jgi:micrococcal nuclease
MKRLIMLHILVFVAPALAGGPGYSGRVVGVTDGDTLTVLNPQEKQIKIRLHGIDAPGSSQDFGQRAKQAASELAFGKTVRIEPKVPTATAARSPS